MSRKSYLLIALVLLSQINVLNLDGQKSPKYEMRAVWVATVNNIDWPSKPGLPVEDQKRELIELLDIAGDYKLNTIMFQVRPAADAFYKSAVEPWSFWLNGEQGKSPDPFYDPLDFAIKECRKRGIDIHAWMNPYRAVTDTSNIVSPDHITKLHPEWFLTYGKTVYFDPGLPETRDYVAGVVADIVRRYDIDAVHMDDYFYPYRIAKVNFPDDSSFAKYPRGYPTDLKEDWRRNNVDLIIKQISDSIRSIKPWVEFGISPFGVWRNKDKDSTGSDTKAGQTNYDDLYADIIKWQKEGWIDYITPQIYWQIGKKVADYAILADWWSHNTYGCQLYIGQAPYRVGKKVTEKPWRTSNEILKQVKLNKTYPNIMGSVYFSAKVFRKNPLNLKQKLVRNYYKFQALPPSNKNIRPILPERPSNAIMVMNGSTVQLTWNAGTNNKKFVIYRLKKGKTADINDPVNIFKVTSETELSIPVSKESDPAKYYFVVTSQSQTNTESEPVYFKEIVR